ncbi:unnamed protein product [Effrenium voratum]|nr:unnamed protein product [Effrenium voratum]
MNGEQKAEWFQLFKRFEAEAELTMQNAAQLHIRMRTNAFAILCSCLCSDRSMVRKAAQCGAVRRSAARRSLPEALMLWGLVQAKTFEEQFLEEAMHSAVLDDFLSLTEYPSFVKRMFRELQQREQDAKLSEDKPAPPGFVRKDSLRPTTPLSDGVMCKRLSEVDQRLAELEDGMERNALLVERRALVGRHVEASTSQTLKQQIQLQRYREDGLGVWGGEVLGEV